jgi:spermidine synthase
MARRRRRSRTVFATRSAASGRIRVVDYRVERRLVVNGEILSVYPLDGDWSRVRHEYWWRALSVIALPPRPSVLLVGLGGGTQIHLLESLTRPRLITVIERDPAIVRVAGDWFGLETAGPMEILCADAMLAARGLAREGRRFDFLMEDAAYGDPPERAASLAQALAPLVSARGALVVNRHRHAGSGGLARVLRARFREVTLRHVRRGGENVLLCARGPLSPT